MLIINLIFLLLISNNYFKLKKKSINIYLKIINL